MTTLTVTARGQVTFRKEVLQHLGIKPGERIELELLPDGRAELKAIPQKGSFREPFLDQLHLQAGAAVGLAVDHGGVLVKAQGRLPRVTLAQKLKHFDPATHGGELMADRPTGKESGGG